MDLGDDKFYDVTPVCDDQVYWLSSSCLRDVSFHGGGLCLLMISTERRIKSSSVRRLSVGQFHVELFADDRSVPQILSTFREKGRYHQYRHNLRVTLWIIPFVTGQCAVDVSQGHASISEASTTSSELPVKLVPDFWSEGLHACITMLSSAFTFFVQNFLICTQIICAFCISKFSIFSDTRLPSAPCTEDQCHFAHAMGIFRKMREHGSVSVWSFCETTWSMDDFLLFWIIHKPQRH